MSRQLKLFLAFTAIHLLLAVVCLAYGFGSSMARFDNPDLTEAKIGNLASAIAGVLFLPGRLVWASWASKNLPSIVEWLLVLVNSSLWGLGATVLVFKVPWRSRAA